MSNAVEEFRAVADEIGEKLDEFREDNDRKLAEHAKYVEAVERKLNALQIQGVVPPENRPGREVWIDAETKARVPVLRHGDKLADLSEQKQDVPSIGRLLRGLIVGSKNDDWRDLREEFKALAISSDASGGVLVPEVLSARWIDALRANSVLSQAGVTTIPMPSKSLTVARIVDDPGTAWRAENAGLADTEPTFGAATLHAKTVAAVVKLSLELSQDAANIEKILERVLIGALAQAIDGAGLVGSATDGPAAPAGIFSQAANSVTGIGAPTSWDFLVDGIYELLADNVPADSIGALIAHPSLWRKMAKLKTGISGDNSPLPLAADVARVPKLYTTAAPLSAGDADAVIGNWSDYLFGIRKDITVRVLSESFMGSNMQIGVLAYARCDFVAARTESFCTLEGITV